jgi:hypothetical protein
MSRKTYYLKIKIMQMKIWFTFIVMLGFILSGFSQTIALESVVLEIYDEETSTFDPMYRERYVVDDEKNYKALYYEILYNNEWVSEFHYEYIQNDKGLLIRNSTFYEDPMTGIPVESSRVDYSYDDRDNLIQIEYSHFNPSTQMWDNYVKINRMYDSNDNLIEEITSDWDATTGTYNPNWREVQSYYSDGKLKENITYSNENDVWDPVFKDEYVYNNSGLLSSVLHYGSYIGSNDFGLGSKTEYEYDANGLRTLLLEVAWNEDIMDWSAPYQKEESENTDTYTITQYYDWYENSWLPTDKETFMYDAAFSGQISWPYYETSEAEFDEVEYLYNTILRSKLETNLGEEWDEEISEWVPDQKTVFYWDDQPTSNTEWESPNIAIFPNPTNNFLNIDLSALSGQQWDLTLINQMGQTVRKHKISQRQLSLDISNLPKGIYHLNIKGIGVFKTSTIVKR